jgi:protein SCO1/2
MSRRILATLALLAVVFAVFTGLAIRSGVLAPASQADLIGGPFQLVDQAGKPVDQSLLKGKWSAVFFGYTYCPDICPTSMFALGQAEGLLGARTRNFQTVFVSVDPERDTPARLAAYVAVPGYPKTLRGLTGTPQQVAVAAKAYRVPYQKVGSGPDYAVQHSGVIYLMNPRGRFACVIAPQSAPAEMARKIEAAMQQGAGAQSC